ncbi:hypothetical protein N9V96_02155 [Polaribacter sp.]|nr:hypothetical protein [Polaribacter sp.]
MKKIVLTALVAGSILLSSCKDSTKQKVKDKMDEVGNSIEKGYEETKTNVSTAFNDINIPEFEDEKAEAYLNDYANHIKKSMDAGVENFKNSEFVEETNNFANRSKEVMMNLDEDAQKKFNETKAKIDAKWNEWEKEAKKEMND